MKKTKILHVLNTGTFSGAENVVCQIIQFFNEDNTVEMAYCSLDGLIREVLEEKKILYFPIKSLNKMELRQVIETYQPDIIHAHDVRAAVFSAMCCGKRKMVCTIHGNDIRMRHINIKSISSLVIAKQAFHIFWVSKSCFEEYIFKKIVKRKSSVLYNVIDEKKLHQKVEEDTNTYNYDVVYIGRLAAPKNPMRLLDVLERSIQLYPQINVGIVGTGQQEGELRERIQKDGLQGNIDVLGFKNNPLKILADAKMMIMTSDWEGTPMTVLEALALGVPVISTPTDGIKDLVQNDINGYLSLDNEILAQKIVEYISDSDKQKKMSQGALDMFHKKNNTTLFKLNLINCYFMK